MVRFFFWGGGRRGNPCTTSANESVYTHWHSSTVSFVNCVASVLTQCREVTWHCVGCSVLRSEVAFRRSWHGDGKNLQRSPTSWITLLRTVPTRRRSEFPIIMSCVMRRLSLTYHSSLFTSVGSGLGSQYCRISPPCFLAECGKRRLNQASFVLQCLLFPVCV